jgi:hypothetical protein
MVNTKRCAGGEPSPQTYMWWMRPWEKIHLSGRMTAGNKTLRSALDWKAQAEMAVYQFEATRHRSGQNDSGSR